MPAPALPPLPPATSAGATTHMHVGDARHYMHLCSCRNFHTRLRTATAGSERRPQLSCFAAPCGPPVSVFCQPSTHNARHNSSGTAHGGSHKGRQERWAPAGPCSAGCRGARGSWKRGGAQAAASVDGQVGGWRQLGGSGSMAVAPCNWSSEHWQQQLHKQHQASRVTVSVLPVRQLCKSQPEAEAA